MKNKVSALKQQDHVTVCILISRFSRIHERPLGEKALHNTPIRMRFMLRKAPSFSFPLRSRADSLETTNAFIR